MRIEGGLPSKFPELLNDFRLHDVNALLVIRSRGLLRDRHIALFDAVDTVRIPAGVHVSVLQDGSGSLDVSEIVELVHASRLN